MHYSRTRKHQPLALKSFAYLTGPVLASVRCPPDVRSTLDSCRPRGHRRLHSLKLHLSTGGGVLLKERTLRIRGEPAPTDYAVSFRPLILRLAACATLRRITAL